MSTNNIQVFNAVSGLMEWDGFGEITGFADGQDAISINWDDAGKNKKKVSSDGQSGTLSINNRTDGVLTIKLQPGSAARGVLQQRWFEDRTQMGDLTFSDTDTGESFTLCNAALEGPAQYDRGSEVPDSYDFMFLFFSSDYTPPRNSIQSSINS